MRITLPLTNLCYGQLANTHTTTLSACECVYVLAWHRIAPQDRHRRAGRRIEFIATVIRLIETMRLPSLLRRCVRWLCGLLDNRCFGNWDNHRTPAVLSHPARRTECADILNLTDD